MVAASISNLLISIHALREEGDLAVFGLRRQGVDFYPRPPRGGRPFCEVRYSPQARFLSTPSARRATWLVVIIDMVEKFLSTPSARRATRG